MYRIEVRGVVQGVGFRPSVKRAADNIGASGFVRNDGSHVTIVCDKDPDLFIDEIKKIIGPMARIEEWSSTTVEDDIKDFSILRSLEGERDSSLPPDTAICDNCLKEMMDPNGRRYLYPFTNCTDCGARYTLIEGLPYDRERTSMSEFGMCDRCSNEYSDISFRRFHAQTLSCRSNGPRYRYLGNDLEEISDGWNGFMDCAKDIQKGRTVIVKGWGGMHIVTDPGGMDEMRKWYGRPNKPFAIMAKDIGTVREFAEIPDHSERTLTSPARPILLLKKKDDPSSWARKALDLASPGLSSIGVHLPYSGIHHLLFRALEEIGSDLGWLVMTSANPPGEPMALTLVDAKRMEADGYLVHDRRISARCDDSVLVPNRYGTDRAHTVPGPFDIRSFPIRKARGLIPDPLEIPHKRQVLSLGAERNVTITVTRNGRSYTSPYIGNSRHPDVLDHAKDTSRRFMDLFGVNDPEFVSVDLHPRYETVELGSELADEFGVPLLRFQHHRAHAASLLVDSRIRSMPVVVLDGVGYGDDGRPWGGEIIDASWDGMERIGHLQYFGLPGGDSSVYHPERIAHWLTIENGKEFDLDDDDANYLLKASHAKAVLTSSMGRLLDALSSILLGVTWRSYDGEPAMRLETLLGRSKDPRTSIFRTEISKGQVDVLTRWDILTEHLFKDGIVTPSYRSGDRSSADLAMGMVGSIIDDMISLAIEKGDGTRDGRGRPYVGLSGGVAYDLPIVDAFVSSCHEKGAFPVLHSRVPPGDGGISVGQAALSGFDLDGRSPFIRKPDKVNGR